MKNIQLLLEKTKEIDGDFIETGCWRGGGCIFARHILNKQGLENKKVWCCDSFEGFPPNKKEDDNYEYKWSVQNEMISVKNNLIEDFKNYELYDENNVKIVKGFFENTLPNLDIENISVLRIDCDMYSGIMECLDILYDKVSIGGYIIIDDYMENIKMAIDATHDFRKKRNIQSPLIRIKDEYYSGAYWKKI